MTLLILLCCFIAALGCWAFARIREVRVEGLKQRAKLVRMLLDSEKEGRQLRKLLAESMDQIRSKAS